LKSGLRILIGAPEVPFLIPPKWPKYPVFAILRVSKMALWMPESKFRDHFSIQTSPQNPQKATSGTKIGPRKVIFGHFLNFVYFCVIFPLARAIFFQMQIYQGRRPPIKKCLKQTSLKIKFYKGIDPSRNFFRIFFVIVP